MKLTYYQGKLFTIISSVLTSIVAFIYYYNTSVIVAYNDARAHLNMARLVFDNLHPGFAQIGSVWLPLNHVLMLLFVWQDTLWQTGFAGSIISMLSYVGSAIFIYLLCHELTKRVVPALLGAGIFIFNPNVLYTQATPLTELLLLFFFIGASYFLVKWVSSNYNVGYLILSSFMVFFATLTRYDGWFLFLYIYPTLAIITFYKIIFADVKPTVREIKARFSMLEGRLVLYTTLAGFGILVWLGWNLLIFGDPLYFALGPYSAHAQQARIEEAGSLLTKKNIVLSIEAYWWAMIDNIGSLLMLTGIVGLFFFSLKYRIRPIAMATYSLLTPLFFHIISLYLGFSILVTPELGGSITQEAKTSWFNVRYGLMIIPAIAVFSSYLAKRKILQLVILFFLIAQSALFYLRNDVITITDGVLGTSSLDVGYTKDYLTNHASNSDALILTSISFNNALAFSTGLPLKQFIHEGTGKYWSESMTHPEKYAQWIVMANGDVGDPVYDALIKNGGSVFLKDYSLVLKDKHTNVYERKTHIRNFVYREGDTFMENGKEFQFVGVNSYDLAFRTKEEIDETLSKAAENGITVIRFWAFGEGFAEGFQPKEGVYNTDRLNMLGFVVASAKAHNIKLIISLSNYWSDYGGIPQYLSWHDLPNKSFADKDAFYTNKEIQKNFKNYTATILGYTNPYTNTQLRNEPSIMAWELMNEPRSSKRENSEIVLSWLDTTSMFIKTQDKKHLIFAGAEGLMPSYNDANNGPLADEVGKLASIDAITAHFYYGEKRKSIIDTFNNWSALKKETDKPVFIEEVGFHKDAKENFNQDRDFLIDYVLKTSQEKNLNGVILWNWALKTDTSYGISPLDEKDKTLREIISQYAKNASGK